MVCRLVPRLPSRASCVLLAVCQWRSRARCSSTSADAFCDVRRHEKRPDRMTVVGAALGGAAGALAGRLGFGGRGANLGAALGGAVGSACALK